MENSGILSILGEMHDLLLKYNARACDSSFMDVKRAKKEYGFRFLLDNLKKGGGIDVQYKDPDTGKWLNNRLNTGTKDEAQACVIAIQSKKKTIEMYKAKRARKKTKDDGTYLYKMLGEYYTPDSEYLKKDAANDKSTPDGKQMTIFNGGLANYIIPFLKEKDIRSLQEISRAVYTELKVYMRSQTSNRGRRKGKPLATKTINNIISGFVRILEHHEHIGQLEALPFHKGKALLRITKEDKTETRNNQAAILPREHLEGIIPFMFERLKIKMALTKTKKPDLLASALMAAMGLTMGLRDSELGRIKTGDISRIQAVEGAFFIKVWNNKTEETNKEGGEYRKMVLHPYLAKLIGGYAKKKGKGKEDYLFGNPKTIDGKTDGWLNFRWYKNAIFELYEAMKAREMYKSGEVEKALALETDAKALNAEMEKRQIMFYSFRHTFHHMLTSDYKDGLVSSYFTGHTPAEGVMLSNYLHINDDTPAVFWEKWGSILAEFQGTFFWHPDPKGLDSDLEYFRKKFEEYEGDHGDLGLIPKQRLPV